MVEFDQLGRRVEESEAVRRRAWLGAVLRHPGPALRGRTTVRRRANAARSTLSLVVTALVLATTLVALPGTAGAAGAGFTSDDFSGAGLDPRWSVVDPRGDGDVSVVGTGTTDARLSLSVPAGSGHDAWTPNDSLRVTQPVTDDDLAIDAKFDSVPTKRYQMQGISIHQDQNTWLRADYYHDGSDLRLFASSFTPGGPTIRTNTVVPSRLLAVAARPTQRRPVDRVQLHQRNQLDHPDQLRVHDDHHQRRRLRRQRPGQHLPRLHRPRRLRLRHHLPHHPRRPHRPHHHHHDHYGTHHHNATTTTPPTTTDCAHHHDSGTHHHNARPRPRPRRRRSIPLTGRTACPSRWTAAPPHARTPRSRSTSRSPTPSARLGAADPFDPSSIRVVERGGDGAISDAAVPFQFDEGPGFDAATDATGTLTLLLTGTTAPGAQRDYDVYFDVVGSGHGDPIVTDRVIVTDGVADAGEDTVRIATADSTYFYDKDGGGFTSLLDRDGRDWIGYGPATGSAGQFRGIPNMVFPDGTMHPGADGVTTTIVADGPLKTTLRSTAPGGWVTRWDVFADRARMTVEAAPRAYWFLYEGTPGGLLEPQSDIVVRSDGGEANAATAWTGDLVGEEWAYFGDPGVDRSLYVANHQQDASVDSYYAMDGNMTVFGFGRTGITSSLTGTGRSFSVGLADGVDRAGVSGRISAAVRPVTVALGPPSSATAPPTTTTTTTAPPTTTTTARHHHHRTAHPDHHDRRPFRDPTVLPPGSTWSQGRPSPRSPTSPRTRTPPESSSW